MCARTTNPANATNNFSNHIQYISYIHWNVFCLPSVPIHTVHIQTKFLVLLISIILPYETWIEIKQTYYPNLWANIFLEPTFNTTSHSSRWRRNTFSSVNVPRGCFSEVCARRAGEGGRSPITISPILLRGCWAKCRRRGGEAQPHTESIYNISNEPPS